MKIDPAEWNKTNKNGIGFFVVGKKREKSTLLKNNENKEKLLRVKKHTQDQVQWNKKKKTYINRNKSLWHSMTLRIKRRLQKSPEIVNLITLNEMIVRIT